MNVFKRIKAWISPKPITVYPEVLHLVFGDRPFTTTEQYENTSPALRSFKERDEQLSKLRGEFESLRLSIIMAKRQKRKTSHFVRELANVQAQIINLEVGR